MKSVGFISAIIYISISLAAASLFLVATLAGEYTLVERIGGVGWVFLAVDDYPDAHYYSAGKEKSSVEVANQDFQRHIKEKEATWTGSIPTIYYYRILTLMASKPD